MKLHQLQVIGRIGQDARIIDHQGRKFVAFSLAVDESYKDGNGTKVERVIWYDCNTEQERFFKVVSWLTKGREVLVEGKPSVRVYEKDGRHHGAIRIQVQNISLGYSPNDERPAATAPVAAAPATAGDEENNDLPF
ncbi:single-stranded DNA-binding protein [Spirosoma spitsbergense]|uniref:single-stranded DNA-binding protein n=1 Tax=Spirosoma spitsbergense TaxID=431554 RepID=UPI00036B9D23|nr:single-stranded DNA-binding protein [Spirosoma spitsbergense]